ncbi:hypothetical protein NC653_035522 [Populus alba x Populus x berolinensis]|uniref:Uncharacterized protein n=1 Tax=Populus alba x Populus x berolinensis TaxID=444605 RepID=A0AAD6LQ85_9ROSI|nr:hypothetical protein NC653_035522 [Populus alba x Populus x berolinensis]
MEISRVKSLVFQGRILSRCRGIGFDEGKSEGCGRAIEVGDAGVPLVTQNRSLFEPPLKLVHLLGQFGRLSEFYPCTDH